MSIPRYYLKKREIDTKRHINGRPASDKEVLDLKQYVEDVIDEHVTIDEGLLSSVTDLNLSASEEIDLTAGENLDLNAGTSATIDAATTLIVTGGTGAQVKATTGELDLSAIAGAVDINAGTSATLDGATTVAITSGTGTTVTATTGNVALVATHANGRIAIDGTKLLFNALALLLENASAYASDIEAAAGGINVGALYIHTDGFIHTRLL